MRLLYKYEWMYQLVNKISAVPMWAPALAVLIVVAIAMPLVIGTSGDDEDSPSVVEQSTPAPSPTAPPTPTPEPVPTSTSAPVPTATAVPTRTPRLAPTATLTPTPAPSPTLTPPPAVPAAVELPTATPAPTNTPIPVATATPVPAPTPTQAPVIIGGGGGGGGAPIAPPAPPPTPTALPPPTATPAPSTPTLIVGSATAAPGEDVKLAVTLDSVGMTVRLIQVKLTFDETLINPEGIWDAWFPPTWVLASFSPGPGTLNFLAVDLAGIDQPAVDQAGVGQPIDGSVFSATFTVDDLAPNGDVAVSAQLADVRDEGNNLLNLTLIPGAVTVTTP